MLSCEHLYISRQQKRRIRALAKILPRRDPSSGSGFRFRVYGLGFIELKVRKKLDQVVNQRSRIIAVTAK